MTSCRNSLQITSIWLAINTVLALLIFSFIAIDKDYPLIELFLIVFIITNIVSLLCNLSGNFLGRLFYNKQILLKLSVMLAGAIFMAAIGMAISHFLVLKLFGYSVNQGATGYLLPTILIALIVTTITELVSRLKFRKDELEKNLDEIKLEKELNSENYSLSIKEAEKYHVIKCDDLIYLSSHGKKTTLHTSGRDYETNQLMKNLEHRLSDNFIRIHRQFIINIKFLSQVKYYEGGRYMAYLSDEDESALPVGRKIAPVLKEKLGI